MIDHKKNRNSHVLSDLVAELFGPSNYHKEKFGTSLSSRSEPIPLNIHEKIVFQKGWEQVREHVYKQNTNGEEILSGRDSPSLRYSVGILFPPKLNDGIDDENLLSDEEETFQGDLEDYNSEVLDLGDGFDSSQESSIEEGDLDYEMTTSNQMLQSSAGLSLCINEELTDLIEIKATGGLYKPLNNIEVIWEKNGKPKSSNPIWWARESFGANFEILYDKNKTNFDLSPTNSTHNDFKIEAKIYKKKVFNSKDNSEECIITIVLLNNNNTTNRNTDSLFQTYFEVSVLDKDGNSVILPYPDPEKIDKDDKDGQMLHQIYNNKKVYGIGHGVSADWIKEPENCSPQKIIASFLPVHEMPFTSPDIKNTNDEDLAPSMNLLSSDNQKEWEIGYKQMEEILDEYELWISTQKIEGLDLDIKESMISECQDSLIRMKDGLRLIHSNSEVRQVFKWMNEAMFKQQIRSTDLRLAIFPNKKLQEIDWGEFPKTTNKGKWRAFQIAFILMNLRSIVEPDNQESRDNVELIWFPTGGGKTEAYFGLAAFSILWRRYQNPSDQGTDVLMRYTLRLLTTQQYQRASTLICALDLLREKNELILGQDRITLGLWIGGGSSPNTTSQIETAWRELNDAQNPKNKFVINQCPWCGAEMGIPRSKNRPKNMPPLGYEKEGTSNDVKVTFFCPDSRCDFNLRKGLPLFVDDISIQKETPSMIIGTIDKLALLAFDSGSKNFPVFGRNSDGKQISKPPSLIIQDELHLISGPLGSIAGVWEGVIEDFCTNYSDKENPIKPKIICSTATIRKYEEQILSLYGRTSSTLFPPPGLNSSDSFFGKEISEVGSGKLFVGVLTPSIGSPLVAQTRVFTTLLQSPVDLPSLEEKDPWYTLMLFFNSIRELGGAETLFQTDIPDYLGAYSERHPNLNVRYPNKRERLTGELSNDELPIALEKLLRSTSEDPVDVCLATNILEVGVDIPRLSLMSVVGQPKTTSTYIQATGRVGRNKDRPGLVVTIYSPFKPRDRSHYEKFRTYHETLYSQVEPTSVTPFSTPALEKALHAAMIAYVRIRGTESMKKSPDPFPEDLVNEFYKLMEDRALFIHKNQEYNDPDLMINFKKIINRRISQWKKWQKQDWEFQTNKEQFPLMVRAGTEETSSGDQNVWPTMMNMRSVDADCKLKISDNYISANED